MRHSIFICIILSMLAGCLAQDKPQEKETCPPEWFFDRPAEKGYRYGVGIGDPFYEEYSARDLAHKNAIQDLIEQRGIKILHLEESGTPGSGLYERISGFGYNTTYKHLDLPNVEVIAECVSDGSNPKCLEGTHFMLVRIEEKDLFNK